MQELNACTKRFNFDGKDYEIKVFKNTKEDGREEYIIRAFINDKPANGYSYHVDFMTNLDFKADYGDDAVSHLFDQAESDVKNRIWEKYLRAIAKNAKS